MPIPNLRTHFAMRRKRPVLILHSFFNAGSRREKTGKASSEFTFIHLVDHGARTSFNPRHFPRRAYSRNVH
jgi:hypothetical protein